MGLDKGIGCVVDYLEHRIGRLKVIAKLQSRKFLLAIIGALLVGLSKGLDWNLDDNTLYTIAGIFVSYILGEAYVDAKAAVKTTEQHYYETTIPDDEA
jgi:hypothetical protein